MVKLRLQPLRMHYLTFTTLVMLNLTQLWVFIIVVFCCLSVFFLFIFNLNFILDLKNQVLDLAPIKKQIGVLKDEMVNQNNMLAILQASLNGLNHHMHTE